MKQYLKIGSVISLVGLIAFLFIRIEGYKDANAKLRQDISGAKWFLDAKERENIILREFGQYAVPDTFWDSIPVPYPVHDTLPPDTFYAPIPRIWGHFEIDTVVGLGLKTNPLYVRVKGRVYHPEEYYGLNWLKIYQDSLDSWKPPYLPPEPSQKKRWGLGLSYSRSFSGANSCDYFGLSGRYKRLNLAISYDPWRRGGAMTIGVNILSF